MYLCLFRLRLFLMVETANNMHFVIRQFFFLDNYEIQSLNLSLEHNNSICLTERTDMQIYFDDLTLYYHNSYK